MFHTLIYRNGSDGVRCGNRKVHGDVHVYHANAAAVYACFLGDGTCTWVGLASGRSEDGELYVMECGHAVHVTERGHHCDAGHEHVNAEVRYREGWDYCTPDEAEGLMRAGTFPVLA